MQFSIKHILSTRPLDQLLIQQAAEKNMVIEVQSLITIEPLKDEALNTKIAELALQSITIAITSINAAKSVAGCLQSKPAGWKIFTIGTATREYIAQYFGDHCIAGVAENASSLADVIIAEGVKKLVYFCGNQRRDELPEKLAAGSVSVQEIVVYNTVYASTKTAALYDGILFFSPGAVQSFFSVNTVPQNTVLFAIGATTAESIGSYSNNPVVVSAVPAAQGLVEKAINHFANTILFHDGTTK